MSKALSRMGRHAFIANDNMRRDTPKKAEKKADLCDRQFQGSVRLAAADVGRGLRPKNIGARVRRVEDPVGR
jgi:hypothetical protein